MTNGTDFTPNINNPSRQSSLTIVRFHVARQRERRHLGRAKVQHALLLLKRRKTTHRGISPKLETFSPRSNKPFLCTGCGENQQGKASKKDYFASHCKIIIALLVQAGHGEPSAVLRRTPEAEMSVSTRGGRCSCFQRKTLTSKVISFAFSSVPTMIFRSKISVSGDEERMVVDGTVAKSRLGDVLNPQRALGRGGRTRHQGWGTRRNTWNLKTVPP